MCRIIPQAIYSRPIQAWICSVNCKTITVFWTFLFCWIQKLEKQRHRCYEELRERIEREKKMKKVSEELQLQRHLMVSSVTKVYLISCNWIIDESTCPPPIFPSKLDSCFSSRLSFAFQFFSLLRQGGFSPPSQENTAFDVWIELVSSIRPSKKKKDVSRPRPLHFLAPPLFFYYFLWAKFLNVKNVFL